MVNFRGRILNSFIIFASGIFLLLSFAIANLSIGAMEREQFDSYAKQLQFVSKAIEPGNIDLQETLNRYEGSTDGEISYITQGGEIAATTFEKPPFTEQERFTPSENVEKIERDGRVDFVMTLSPEQSTSDYLVISAEEKTLTNEVRRYWIPVLLTILLSYALLIVVTFRLTGKLVKPVDDAMRVAKELARGNFKARTHEYQLKETGQLNHSLNVLARNLEQITELREAEQERMSTVIENMDSGLLLIDSKGYINLMNRAYRSLFEIDSENWKEALYHEIMPNEDVIELVDETFLTETTVKKQVTLSIGIDRKHFHLTCVPILGQKDKVKGIVLVFHDITELKNLEQMRKDFVANVSHELRTPVTSLKGFAETLLDGAMESKELREKFLTIIWKESDRLQNLIQDLLEFTKMEQSNFQLNWQRINLETIVNDVVTLLEPRAEQKDIEVFVEIEGDLKIEGDSARMKQIMINLLNNALSYTPNGGSIWITGKEEDDKIHLEVKDTGIGITEDEIPRVFERFYRVDKARSRNSGGTGLGLAIVKHLVEAHKGSVKVTSQKDVGTTFTLTFFKTRQD
ncbi:two-component system histidine kinase PnpS [Alkalihalobacillus sp. TS-13]|uniref:two-component system histidine kinase PnpS n=1 Tax=Alkalihalobacillus sp. TS-13 TaxID=2842455 RepID=UPI001C86AC75|nr:ATP-binding protein [Alkalihalobacillus sp. TS-13]